MNLTYISGKFLDKENQKEVFAFDETFLIQKKFQVNKIKTQILAGCKIIQVLNSIFSEGLEINNLNKNLNLLHESYQALDNELDRIDSSEKQINSNYSIVKRQYFDFNLGVPNHVFVDSENSVVLRINNIQSSNTIHYFISQLCFLSEILKGVEKLFADGLHIFSVAENLALLKKTLEKIDSCTIEINKTLS